MISLTPAMEDALARAYESLWRPGTRVAVGKWHTIKALRSRGLCGGDGQLTDEGERERARIVGPRR